jgi:colanic acid biosynthesis glycosyl transferase WcaI
LPFVKILIYSANFAPEPVGIGKYSGEMASWMASQGHDVRVVAAPPYYPEWKIQPEYRRPRYRHERWREVDVWRTPVWVPTNPGALKRIVHLLSFAISSFPVMVRQAFWRPDLVITVAPAIVCAPAGWLVARACRAQCWLHVQDFEIDIAFKMSMLKSGGLQRFALGLERWMLRRFDTVSSISQNMVKRLISKGVPAERTRHFPNWVDISHVHPSCDGSAYRERLGIAPEAVVVLYAGSLGAKHGLMLIPAVAELLRDRSDIVFVICGDGVMKQPLAHESRHLANVKLLPLQPFERLGDLLCMATIHLLPQSADATDLVLPSKLSGMLASGRPVIATCPAGSELESVVSRCGIVVRPDDKAGVADAIVRLADGVDTRLQLGLLARLWAEANFESGAVLARAFGYLNASKTGHASHTAATKIVDNPPARTNPKPAPEDTLTEGATDQSVVGF